MKGAALIKYVWILVISLGCGDTLKFINGDSLSGDPIMLGEESKLAWNASSLDARLHASIPLLDKVVFTDDGTSELEVLEGTPVGIKMRRGDIYHGEIKKVTPEKIILFTTWAGELEVNRQMIVSIKVFGGFDNLLGDTLDLSTWESVINRQMWKQGDDGLVSVKRGAICREVDFSDQFHIGCRLYLKGTPRLRFLFLASEGNLHEPDSYLEFVIQNTSLLAKARTFGEIEALGQSNGIKDLEKPSGVQLDLYQDLEAQTMTVYLDGVQVGQWGLPIGLNGDWLYLYCDYDGTALVTEFNVEKWNGALPSDLEKAVEEFTEDTESVLFLLSTGDVVDSDLQSFSEESFLTESSLGEVSVPLKNTKEVSFARLPYREAKRCKGDVKVWLKDESVVTLRLDSWEEGKLSGLSQNFGEVRLQLPYVKEVQFNLYRD